MSRCFRTPAFLLKRRFVQTPTAQWLWGLICPCPMARTFRLIKSCLAHWRSLCSAVLPNPSWIYTLAVRILSISESPPLQRTAFRPGNALHCNEISASQMWNFPYGKWNTFGMNYSPLANIKSLRRFFIHTAMQPYCFGRLNSIVSGFPTLIEVRRSRKRHCLSAENSMAFAVYKIHFINWNLFQFFNHHFCGLVNVTATEGNNNISLLSVF